MSNSIKILVVDDLPKPRRYMHKKLCSNPQWSVDMASSEKEAVQKINDNQYDIIVTDMYMEERNSGLNVLYAAKKKDKLIEVIIITGYAGIQDTVKAMREGAFHYINKDDKTPYVLCYKIVEKAIEKREKIKFSPVFVYDINISDGDKKEIKSIANQLRNWAIKPVLFENLSPGMESIDALQRNKQDIKTIVAFIGENQSGPWENKDIDQYLKNVMQSKPKQTRIIPAILRTCNDDPQFPDYLSGINYVDFRPYYPNPLLGLVWGITDVKSPEY